MFVRQMSLKVYVSKIAFHTLGPKMCIFSLLELNSLNSGNNCSSGTGCVPDMIDNLL